MFAITRLFVFVETVVAAGLADAETLSAPGCTVMVLMVTVVFVRDSVAPEV